jgi:hypothetical protein
VRKQTPKSENTSFSKENDSELNLTYYVSRVVKYNKKSFQYIMLPDWLDWLDWLSYLAGSSKSHREISISCIFLQSPHQVDMKNFVKWWKDFLLYFTTLETYHE